MYVPEHFRESRIGVLQELLVRHPLATLVAMTPAGLEANHVPLLSALGEGAADGRPGGVLRGHIARANSLWRVLDSGATVLAVFMGADSYVSPAAYAAKREHGRVVPTWNYVAVHVTGRIRFIDDPQWLLEVVTRLTEVHEAARAAPWRVSDAPPDYIDGMLRAIVGIEIEVTAIVGKVKGSQNRSAADREGVRAMLGAAGRSEQELGELAPR